MRMKWISDLDRRLLVAGTAAALVIGAAAPAMADQTSYTGHVREQAAARVEFTLVRHAGGGEFIKPFRFEHIKLTCSLGPHHITISHGRFRKIPVTDDAFQATKHHTDVAASVRGHLVRHGQAHGRLRVTEDAAMCDSGVLHWHAHT